MHSRRSVLVGGLAGACGLLAWSDSGLAVAPGAAGEASGLKLPFKVSKMHGSKVLNELDVLSRSGKGFPVVLGDRESVDRLQESLSYTKESAEELIRLSEKIDADSWFGRRAAKDPEQYKAPRGKWPTEDQRQTEIFSHLDLVSGKPLEEVYVGMIPVAESWQVPCVLKFGGWNECPSPQEHAAILRRWNKKYGAEVVAVTGDVLETHVKRPPASKAEALALAKEHFVYCSDIVHQGTSTIDALAASLLNAPAWFFWWD